MPIEGAPKIDAVPQRELQPAVEPIDLLSTMSAFDRKNVCEVVTVESDDDFRRFMERSPTGIALGSRKDGEHPAGVVSAAASDFAKWMRTTYPAMRVELPTTADRLLLRNGDIWMPVAFLASDVALPIYLNLVASYIYDRMKGALLGEKSRVHLSAEYQDKSSGITKRFNYEGDGETLRAVAKKFDLNEFLDERRPPK